MPFLYVDAAYLSSVDHDRLEVRAPHLVGLERLAGGIGDGRSVVVQQDYGAPQGETRTLQHGLKAVPVSVVRVETHENLLDSK